MAFVTSWLEKQKDRSWVCFLFSKQLLTGSSVLIDSDLLLFCPLQREQGFLGFENLLMSRRCICVDAMKSIQQINICNRTGFPVLITHPHKEYLNKESFSIKYVQKVLVRWGVLWVLVAFSFFFFFPAGFLKQFFLRGMFSTWSLTSLKVETDVNCGVGKLSPGSWLKNANPSAKWSLRLLRVLGQFFFCRTILKSVRLHLQRFLLELKYMLQNCDSWGISHGMLEHSHLQLLLSKIQWMPSNEYTAVTLDVIWQFTCIKDVWMKERISK